MSEHLRVITNSQQRCTRRCLREVQLSYVLGYRPVTEAEAMRFGSLFHFGLRAWWESPTERLAAAIEAMRPFAIDEYDLVRAGALMQGYDARWGDEAMTVLAVEHEFRAPLMNPATGHPSRTFELGGKLDAVVEHGGRVKLVEHKTTSDDITPGSTYWKRLLMDPQISTYFAGGKVAGYDIQECIYDVIGKPALRPSQVPLLDERGSKIVLDASGQRVRTKQGKWRETADSAQGYVLQTRPETPLEFHSRLVEHISENPDRYYQRGKVVRLEQEEADAAQDAWNTVRLFREAELSQRWPRNPDSCIRYNRVCSYFDVCTGTASLSDTTRFRKAERVHEELSPEEAA